MNIPINCRALLLAAVEMFNCGMRILGISCHSKNSADSLSLLKTVVLLIVANRIHVNDQELLLSTGLSNRLHR